MSDITTIAIRKLTRNKLERFKQHKRETMDDVITYLIKITKKKVIK